MVTNTDMIMLCIILIYNVPRLVLSHIPIQPKKNIPIIIGYYLLQISDILGKKRLILPTGH